MAKAEVLTRRQFLGRVASVAVPLMMPSLNSSNDQSRNLGKPLEQNATRDNDELSVLAIGALLGSFFGGCVWGLAAKASSSHNNDEASKTINLSLTAWGTQIGAILGLLVAGCINKSKR